MTALQKRTAMVFAKNLEVGLLNRYMMESGISAYDRI